MTKILIVAAIVLGICGSSTACNHDSEVKPGMSAADVHRMLGQPFSQTTERKVFEAHLLPADCLASTVKADVYKRFMGAHFIVAYGRGETVTCTMDIIIE